MKKLETPTRKWCRRCQKPKPFEQFVAPRLYCEPCREEQDKARKPKPKSVGSKRRALRKRHAAEGRIDAVEAVSGKSVSICIGQCGKCKRIVHGMQPLTCNCAVIQPVEVAWSKRA